MILSGFTGNIVVYLACRKTHVFRQNKKIWHFISKSRISLSAIAQNRTNPYLDPVTPKKDYRLSTFILTKKACIFW
jgi:hypothetical protein